MKKSTKIIISLVLIACVITLYDIHTQTSMRKNAEPCGFLSNYGAEKVCRCSGKMVDDNSPMNPLLKKTGGVNYYCYGGCYDCRCYEFGNMEDWRNNNKKEIACPEI